jgi:hypothetical protein
MSYPFFFGLICKVGPRKVLGNTVPVVNGIEIIFELLKAIFAFWLWLLSKPVKDEYNGVIVF